MGVDQPRHSNQAAPVDHAVERTGWRLYRCPRVLEPPALDHETPLFDNLIEVIHRNKKNILNQQ